MGEALVRPLWASEDDWKLLVDKSADVERYAETVARIVLAGVSETRRDAAWDARDKEIKDIEETTRVIQDDNRNLAEHGEAPERRLADFYPEKTQQQQQQQQQQEEHVEHQQDGAHEDGHDDYNDDYNDDDYNLESPNTKQDNPQGYDGNV